MRKTIWVKLYNSKRNKHLHKMIDLGSHIYNYAIALHKRFYGLYKKHLNKYKLQKHLTKTKKRKAYFNNLGSQAIQDITDRIDRSYTLFFRNRKNKIKTAPPNFKKRKRYKSITLKQAGFKLLNDNKIIIDKRVYKFFAPRKIEGVIKTLTIKRDALGDIYLFFSCEVKKEKKNKTMTGKKAGFDFGLKTFLTSSEDVQDIESPLFYKKSLKKIKKAHRSLSKKKKGSNGRKKALKTLFRLYKKLTDQRKDYQFKLANKLTDKYDFLFFEDLNIEHMKKIWGRKISDLRFSSFLKIAEYYCSLKGKNIKYVDRFYPSSKTCYYCRDVYKDLKIGERTWICPNCKKMIFRDKNAAMNIKRQGIVLWHRENKTSFIGAFPVLKPESHRL